MDGSQALQRQQRKKTQSYTTSIRPDKEREQYFISPSLLIAELDFQTECFDSQENTFRGIKNEKKKKDK